MRISKRLPKHNLNNSIGFIQRNWDWHPPQGITQSEWVYELFKEMLNFRLECYVVHKTTDIYYVFGFKAYVLCSHCPNFYSVRNFGNNTDTACGYVAGIPIYYSEEIGDKILIKTNDTDTLIGEINII
jgi:hypothetical protein